MRTRFIEGWPGYLITDDGRVWSEKTKRWLKPQKLSKGYLGVSFYPGPKPRAGKTMKIHQLVAEAFVLNPENKPEINHKDGEKENCHWENLEWVTTLENSHHAHRNDLRGKATKLTVAQVIEIRGRLRNGEQGRAIAGSFGISEQLVSNIKTGYRWGWLNSA